MTLIAIYARATRGLSGKTNPVYDRIHVFDDDHPSVDLNAPAIETPRSSFNIARHAQGFARVVYYSPRHDLTLRELSRDEIEQLLRVWQQHYLELGAARDRVSAHF